MNIDIVADVMRHAKDSKLKIARNKLASGSALQTHGQGGGLFTDIKRNLEAKFLPGIEKGKAVASNSNGTPQLSNTSEANAKAKTTSSRQSSEFDLVAGVMAAADQNKMASATEKLSLNTMVAERVESSEPKLGLEQVLATKLVETMMPKDDSSLYGEGTAGDIWKSMHAETMGQAIAKAGVLSDEINGSETVALPSALSHMSGRGIVAFAA